jgi:hypothetical protein
MAMHPDTLIRAWHALVVSVGASSFAMLAASALVGAALPPRDAFVLALFVGVWTTPAMYQMYFAEAEDGTRS